MTTLALKNYLKTALTYAAWTVIVPPIFIIMFPLVLLPKRIRYTTRAFYTMANIASWLIVKASFLRIEVHDKKYLSSYPHDPSIIVFNHASSLDIPLAQIVIGNYPYAWIGHERYGKIPLLGILFRNMHISLKKMSGSDGRTALLALYNAIKDCNRHALIFPEGTRHADGKIHTFYHGFAMLSQRLKRPIIPVYISSMHTIYPKQSLVIDSSNNTVKIIIGEPIFPTNDQTTENVVEQVHSWFEEKINSRPL